MLRSQKSLGSVRENLALAPVTGRWKTGSPVVAGSPGLAAALALPRTRFRLVHQTLNPLFHLLIDEEVLVAKDSLVINHVEHRKGLGLPDACDGTVGAAIPPGAPVEGQLEAVFLGFRPIGVAIDAKDHKGPLLHAFDEGLFVGNEPDAVRAPEAPEVE